MMTTELVAYHRLQDIEDFVRAAFFEERYVDTTLAVFNMESRYGDERSMRAHSLVLSAASPLFKAVLNSCDGTEDEYHVIFPDVDLDDLKAVIDATYMNRFSSDLLENQEIEEILQALRFELSDTPVKEEKIEDIDPTLFLDQGIDSKPRLTMKDLESDGEEDPEWTVDGNPKVKTPKKRGPKRKKPKYVPKGPRKCFVNADLKDYPYPQSFLCRHCVPHCTYNTADELMEHYTDAHGKKRPAQCGVCHRVFGTKGSMLTHRGKEHGQNHMSSTKECPVCHKVLRGSLQYHMRKHTGENPYVCDICGRGFSQSANMIKHRTIHSGEKPFECGDCGRKFRERAGLLSHRETHVDKELVVKNFTCEKCGASFKTKKQEARHQIAHKTVRDWICEFCGKGFKDKISRNMHQKYHTGINLAKCDQCDGSFRSNHHLQRHIETVHLNLKRFSCEYCGCPFKQKAHVKDHQRKGACKAFKVKR